MMRVLMGCLLALLLTGCAANRMSPDVTTRLKQGKTAVLFHDDIGEIKYIEDKYFVLGVAQVASNGTYAGVWNPNPEMSQWHAEQLNGMGLQAQSAYQLLPAAFIEANTSAERELYTLKPHDKSNPKPATPAVGAALQPKLREALIEKGVDSLAWVSWSGFSLHLRTLGLSPQEQYTTGFWFFDVKSNRLLWNGAVSTWETVTIPDGQTGKDFIESNGLAGLKAESAARVKDAYRSDQVNFKNFGIQSGLGAAK